MYINVIISICISCSTYKKNQNFKKKIIKRKKKKRRKIKKKIIPSNPSQKMIKKTIKAFGINEYKACISKNTKVATCKIDGAQIV